MKDLIKNIKFSDSLSFLALVIAAISLSWNIIRDYITDKLKINFSISVGELKTINGYNETGVFVDAGSTKYLTISPKLLISITNIGRRNIVLYRIGGNYKNHNEDGRDSFSMVVANLPKKLEPFEIFSTVVKIPDGFIEEIQKRNIKDIWVEDTSCKKWRLSKLGWKKLEETINTYVAESK